MFLFAIEKVFGKNYNIPAKPMIKEGRQGSS